MNNSKKLKTKKVIKDRIIENKPITKISKRWIIASAVLLVILIAAILFDQFYEKTIMTIDGKDYKLSDTGYYFYAVESSYNYYDQMFGGGGAYWDMINDEESGQTVRDTAKVEALNTVLYNEIIYKEAVAAGYSLTDEEKTTINEQADSLFNDTLSSSQITKGKFTEKKLADVIGKETLVARFRQDKIDSFDIDDEAIKAGINYDEYRQYDIEYLYIPTSTTDDSGNSVAMTDEEKSAAFDKINSYYETAKTTEDWSTLLPEEEEEVKYSDTSFVESGTAFSEDMEKMMIAMENGDISEIYESEDGYYIIRMKDNNSSESYDTAVENAISEKENEKFTEYYEEVKKNHEFATNEKTVESMKMGSIILE